MKDAQEKILFASTRTTIPSKARGARRHGAPPDSCVSVWNARVARAGIEDVARGRDESCRRHPILRLRCDAKLSHDSLWPVVRRTVCVRREDGKSAAK